MPVHRTRSTLILILIPILILGWWLWPWLRPFLWPANGADWLVVLDGYHRLDHALERQTRTAQPILLITCPLTGQPTPSQRRWARRRGSRAARLVVLQHGFDTATQMVALARWLEQQSSLGLSQPRRILVVSDSHHFPRASLAAQIAVGGAGTRVSALPVSALPSASPPWPTWRDALRLQLWRLTGSTGGLLNPPRLRSKIRACWGNPPP